MEYQYKNFLFRNLDNKGILYKDNQILFIGNPWSGILQFLSATDNAPEVKQMFKAQLDQREQIRFKAESKKPRDPEPIKREEPKKEPIFKRSRNDRKLVR